MNFKVLLFDENNEINETNQKLMQNLFPQSKCVQTTNEKQINSVIRDQGISFVFMHIEYKDEPNVSEQNRTKIAQEIKLMHPNLIIIGYSYSAPFKLMWVRQQKHNGKPLFFYIVHITDNGLNQFKIKLPEILKQI